MELHTTMPQAGDSNSSSDWSEDSNSTFAEQVDSDNQESFLQLLIIGVGLVGAATSGLDLWALLGKNARSKTANILILNLSFFNFMACVFVVVSYGIKVGLGGMELTQAWATTICILFLNDTLIYASLDVSIATLCA